MSFEKPPGGEGEKEKPTIAGADSFNELFAAIDELGGVQGSERFYSAEELKERISAVRARMATPKSITKSEGLREKVLELMQKEHEGTERS